MSINTNDKKFFLTGFPNGTLKPVTIIEERKDRPGYYYIRYDEGGTDTTLEKFLFDVPEIKPKTTNKLITIKADGLEHKINAFMIQLLKKLRVKMS